MILIVEDSVDVNNMLAMTLQDAGYETVSAYTGIEATKLFNENEYEIVLLDMMLPYKSGDVILKEIREVSLVPVIVISAKDMVATKVDMLKLGADDYITKPFDLTEVVARVESNIRRSTTAASSTKRYTYKNIELDASSKRVFIDNNELELTAKEFQILELMICNKDKVFTKANLYETVWGEEYIGDDNAVKTHMSNLRSKLKKADSDTEYIETVWGLGYRLS